MVAGEWEVHDRKPVLRADRRHSVLEVPNGGRRAFYESRVIRSRSSLQATTNDFAIRIRAQLPDHRPATGAIRVDSDTRVRGGSLQCAQHVFGLLFDSIGLGDARPCPNHWFGPERARVFCVAKSRHNTSSALSAPSGVSSCLNIRYRSLPLLQTMVASIPTHAIPRPPKNLSRPHSPAFSITCKPTPPRLPRFPSAPMLT